MLQSAHFRGMVENLSAFYIPYGTFELIQARVLKVL